MTEAQRKRKSRRRPSATQHLPQQQIANRPHVIDQTMTAGVTNVRYLSPLELWWHRNAKKPANQRSIDERMYLAGRQLREDWEVGIMGATDPEGRAEIPPGIRATTHDGYAVRQIEAATRYRCALAAMGKHLSWAVELLCITEMTVEQIAQSNGGNHHRVIGTLQPALNILADYYERL